MTLPRRSSDRIPASPSVPDPAAEGAALARPLSIPRLLNTVRDTLKVLGGAARGDLAPTSPLERRIDRAGRLISAGSMIAGDVADQARKRLNAPLVLPRFSTRREYRVWKARRIARPDAWSPLQWPLLVWLLVGLAAVLGIRSLFS